MRSAPDVRPARRTAVLLVAATMALAACAPTTAASAPPADLAGPGEDGPSGPAPVAPAEPAGPASDDLPAAPTDGPTRVPSASGPEADPGTDGAGGPVPMPGGLAGSGSRPRPAAPDGGGGIALHLTFDDGPHPVTTPAILDLLAAHGAHATFFVIGSLAEQHPDLVRRMVDEGHTVGNHTWGHRDLTTLSADAFAREAARADEAVVAASGIAPRCLRPPFGRFDASVRERTAAAGLTFVYWDVDPKDWRRPGVDAIVRRVLDGARPNAVVILHDGGGDRSQTVTAVERLLPTLGADYALTSVPGC